MEGDQQLRASGGVAPGDREVLATVSPRRGRLLLMLGPRWGAGLTERRWLKDGKRVGSGWFRVVFKVVFKVVEGGLRCVKGGILMVIHGDLMIVKWWWNNGEGGHAGSC